MAWYEYRPAAKPLYRQYEPEPRATLWDVFLVYGALLLGVVVLFVGLIAIAVFSGWQTLWFVLAVGAAYFVMAARQR